tara:strand:- start:689 stop:1909 length:1221 start_codon:yes stop_codon:yes gene_type:complete
MAISDDIRQLVKREQDIQGVLGVLDTYLSNKSKARQAFKPAVAKKVDSGDLYKYDIDGKTGYIRENELDDFTQKNPNANIGKVSTYKSDSKEDPQPSLKWTWRNESGETFYGSEEEAINARNTGEAVVIGKTTVLKDDEQFRQKSDTWKNQTIALIEQNKNNMSEEEYQANLDRVNNSTVWTQALHKNIKDEYSKGLDRNVNVYDTKTGLYTKISQGTLNEDAENRYLQNKNEDVKRASMKLDDKKKSNIARGNRTNNTKSYKSIIQNYTDNNGNIIKATLEKNASKGDKQELYRLQEEIFIDNFLVGSPYLERDSFKFYSGDDGLDNLVNDLIKNLPEYFSSKKSRGENTELALKLINQSRTQFLQDPEGYIKKNGQLVVLNNEILGNTGFITTMISGFDNQLGQ